LELETSDMQIVHDPSWKMVLADESDPRQARRSKGLHLSHILRDLDIQLYHKEYEGNTISPMFAKRGFMFEWMLSQAFKNEECPPDRINQVELVKDDIFMTPDAWVLGAGLSGRGVLDEYKATDKSMKKLDPNLPPHELAASMVKHFRTWLWQIMAYLWALQMLECHLYVFFIRGDYKWDGARGVDTIPKYILTFQPWELAENWDMILNHKETMARRG
jgi:hypothetical protein